MGPSIAILPFDNLSKDNTLRLLCEGFSIDLMMELSRFSQFQIITMDSYIPTNPVDVEQMLINTDYFIRGSFRYFSDKIRINAHLIETKSRRVVWADRLENSLEALFDIQEELLQQIVAKLQENLDIDLLSKVRRNPAKNFKAYEFWLSGINELRKGSVEADTKAREYFEKALELDAGYSLAYSGISLSYFNEWSCQIWDKWELNQSGAKKWAIKALEMDHQNYIANLIAGRVHLFEFEFELAETLLSKAEQLNPNDPFNLIQIASSYVYLGKLDEAENLYLKAIELRPFQKDYYQPFGAHIYFELGQFKKCLEIGETYAMNAWVDYPVILAAAKYYVGDMEGSLYYWKMYLELYNKKIKQGLDNIEESALRWNMKYNPYKIETKFMDFWNYISDIKQLEINQHNEKEKPSYEHSFLYSEGIWNIVYNGFSAQLVDTKGLQDLGTLISNSNKQIHCTELMGSRVIEETEDLLDEKAKNQYQRRIIELKRAIQDAEDNNDLSNLSSLHREYDDLLEHLSKTLDFRGKSRKFQRSDDKARSAVTQRIKGAIKKIEKIHPELGEHLSKSIRTGIYCSYDPNEDINWKM